MSFDPSSSPLEPEGMLDGIQWGKVATGAVLDIAASWLALIPVLLFLTGSQGLEGDEEAMNEAIRQASLSPEFLWISASIGLGISVAVAFWVAVRAGDRHVLHGGWTAMATVLLGFMLSLIAGEDANRQPAWFEALGYGLMMPAGMFGGWLASRFDRETS
jgi:hypothetical protein